jgi:hypothetical protein
VRREVKSDLTARVESRADVGHLPWGGARGGPKVSDALGELIRPCSQDYMGVEACRSDHRHAALLPPLLSATHFPLPRSTFGGGVPKHFRMYELSRH